MKLVKNLVLLSGLLLALSCSCEKNIPATKSDSNPFYRLMFYNVENLFDTLDNPGTMDEEFMPEDDKNWNSVKYYDKLNKIARVITDVGDGEYPAVIGLCEVENLSVLEGLCLATSLKEIGYQIVHKESPDFRGIDVALLFRPDVFKLLNYKTWPVWIPFSPDTRTREILYACGELPGKDTIHIFANHWPSRSGGEVETRPKRVFVAEMLRSKVDSILAMDPDARIVITGDFNDEPTDLSIVSGLSAYSSFDDPQSNRLYNTSHFLQKNIKKGSYKYKGNWNMLDQFIISGALLDTSANIYSSQFDVHLFEKNYLLEKDDTFLGDKPFRTYLGDYYHGGYSDHLPVYLDIRHK